MERKQTLLSGQGFSQRKVMNSLFPEPSQLPFLLHESMLLPLLSGNLHMAHHGCRPWIAILCWPQINPPFLEKYLTVLSVGAAQMSIDRWMDKLSMANTYNGILFSLKKEENVVTCYNMDEPWENHTKRSKAWDFPDGPVLRLSLPVQGLGIRSLVRELGSHVPHGQKTKT